MRQGVPNVSQNARGLLGLFGTVVGDADIQGLPLADSGVERAHRLLERSVGVGAVAVENVHVVEPHALERGVEAGEQIFARAPLAVGTGPHIVARLGGDDEFVAVGMKVLLEEQAEGILGGTGRRTVIVGEVEVRDAHVEGAAGDGAAVLDVVAPAEVVPPTERDGREFQSTAANAVVGHG